MQRSEIQPAPTGRSEIAGGADVPQRLAHDVPETAVLLGGVTERYVWKLISSGELPSFLLGKRRMVYRQDIEELIRQLRADELTARAAAAGRPA
ncbi:helix-turn-helix domain-containing protein [Micromonospora sp. CPCC 205371]|nr:helix-turn-helix domain-containing protein [Micromonospora sp. CPCC 205371]